MIGYVRYFIFNKRSIRALKGHFDLFICYHNDLDYIFTVPVEEEDSEEELSLKRKAKPSRKSASGDTFRSPALSTPAGRTRGNFLTSCLTMLHETFCHQLAALFQQFACVGK